MKELDLLKKDWNKETHPKVSTDMLYKMILKKSSSAVKWIFIISMIELGLGLISGFLYTPELNSEYQMPVWISGWPTTVLVTSIALYFIFRFYKNYKTINTTNSVKDLLTSIITTRRTVKLYIIINIALAAVLFASSLVYVLTNPYTEGGAIFFDLVTTKDYLILGVLTLFATAFMVGTFLLLYFLLYGILMRKLNKNYKELKRLDL